MRRSGKGGQTCTQLLKVDHLHSSMFSGSSELPLAEDTWRFMGSYKWGYK